MIWLLFSILSSTCLFLIFKFFGKFNIHIFPAIVINYITCFILGNIHLGADNLFTHPAWQENWFPKIAFLGIFFISTFYLMGLGTKQAGAGATSVSAKMSVVIPALFAIFFWQEKFKWIQYIGILLSLTSVYLVTPDTPEEHKKHKAFWILILVFVGSGIVDTSLNIVKHDFGKWVSDGKISTIVFGMAGLIGFIIVLAKYKILKPGKKEILGGFILGVMNYFSLIAMFGALEYYKGGTAIFFAINNIGVVICSTLFAVLLFKEKIYRKEKMGLFIAVIAILFMNYYAFF